MLKIYFTNNKEIKINFDTCQITFKIYFLKKPLFIHTHNVNLPLPTLKHLNLNLKFEFSVDYIQAHVCLSAEPVSSVCLNGRSWYQIASMFTCLTFTKGLAPVQTQALFFTTCTIRGVGCSRRHWLISIMRTDVTFWSMGWSKDKMEVTTGLW